MKQRSGPYPVLTVDGQGSSVVPNAGAVLLLRTAQAVGLTAALSQAVAPWRRPLARHDPGKVLLDLAVSLAVGGDCLADLAQLRAAPEVFGPVASDPTVSRLIDTLAGDAPAALAAIARARAVARARAWALAGEHAPDHHTDAFRPLVIDVDATLVTAHSEKECAAPTFKRGFGFHPLWAFCDHRPEGTGEPLAVLLRRGNAGSNTVADHITVLRAALAQLPGGRRPGKNVLVRIDGAGGTHELINWLTRRRLSYSVGFSLPGDLASIQAKLASIPPTSGSRPTTPTARSAPAPGSPRSPGWSTSRTGRPGCGWSCAANARTPAPNCESPTSTATGSPRSSRTPPAGSWPIWSCGTAAGPAPKTASAPRKTPGWPTCRCTTSPRTRSGAPSSRWPPT